MKNILKYSALIISSILALGFLGYVMYVSAWCSDAYIYIPAGMRAAPKYTDVKMFDCSWCHRTQNLNRHHVIPQSADPSLTHVYTNIIVLCRDCHFVLGHRCNWKHFNPDVMEIVEKYTTDIPSSSYLMEYK